MHMDNISQVRNIDMVEVREKMEMAFEFDYVENEGKDCVRFDRGANSFWLYANGSVQGDVKGMKMTLMIRVLGFDLP